MTDWLRWLERWDGQQEHLLGDRDERFDAMFDVVDAVIGVPDEVLDVAGGPGSVTAGLRRRFPSAKATLIDVDPALLAIARGVFGNDPQVRIVPADLTEPTWANSFQARTFDAALTASSLHWLTEPALRRVYADLALLVRPGGVVCNTDLMMPDGGDQIIAALERRTRLQRTQPCSGLGGLVARGGGRTRPSSPGRRAKRDVWPWNHDRRGSGLPGGILSTR